jgi:hypothetical protein
MIARLLLASLATTLAACNVMPKREQARAVPAQCAVECLTPCDASNPRWNVAADDPKAWDALGNQVIEPLLRQRDTCEKHRAACVQCLQRLESAGLICGVAKGCVP